jgi:Uma2 family endonuclease
MVQLQQRKTAPQPKQLSQPQIIWESLPEDYLLPDEPAESILQPLLAASLTEALDLAGLITATMLIASNMALVAQVDGQSVIKAPDWFYVTRVLPVGEEVIRRSYTPHREGEIPAIVMEFLSATDAGEYSIRPSFPYGKMWFYERIIQVPSYVIFDPASGSLEVRQLNSEGVYELRTPDEKGRYFLESIGLHLGVWHGKRIEQTVYWLRWWDKSGKLLLWGSELIEQEKQRAEQEKQRAEQEQKRAELAELEVTKLRELWLKEGLEVPETDLSNPD